MRCATRRSKVLRSIRPIERRGAGRRTALRARYAAGTVDGRAERGYLDEPGVAAASTDRDVRGGQADDRQLARGAACRSTCAPASGWRGSARRSRSASATGSAAARSRARGVSAARSRTGSCSSCSRTRRWTSRCTRGSRGIGLDTADGPDERRLPRRRRAGDTTPTKLLLPRTSSRRRRDQLHRASTRCECRRGESVDPILAGLGGRDASPIHSYPAGELRPGRGEPPVRARRPALGATTRARLRRDRRQLTRAGDALAVSARRSPALRHSARSFASRCAVSGCALQPARRAPRRRYAGCRHGCGCAARRSAAARGGTARRGAARGAARETTGRRARPPSWRGRRGSPAPASASSLLLAAREKPGMSAFCRMYAPCLWKPVCETEKPSRAAAPPSRGAARRPGSGAATAAR